jgi:hypothetical protein
LNSREKASFAVALIVVALVSGFVGYNYSQWSTYDANRIQMSVYYINDYAIPINPHDYNYTNATQLSQYWSLGIQELYPQLTNATAVQPRTLLVMNATDYEENDTVEWTSIKIYSNNSTGQTLGEFALDPWNNATLNLYGFDGTGYTLTAGPDNFILIVTNQPIQCGQSVRVILYDFNQPIAEWVGVVH